MILKMKSLKMSYIDKYQVILLKSLIIDVIEVKDKAPNQALILIVMKKIKIIMIGYLFSILMNFLN